MQTQGQWVSAGLLAIGMVVASLILGAAVRDFRISDRHVEVKGFAEQEVAADLAIWPINYQLAAGSLEELRREMRAADDAVVAFLNGYGFADDEISRNPPRISDLWMHAHGDHRPPNRYSAERGLTLRTRQVDATVRALQDSAELVSQGVLLTPNWGQAAQFLFTGLDDLKPAMIAAATADARRAASQFAADSDSRIGPIRSARQGFFSITERDPSTPELKLIRVVATIEYILE